MKVLVACEESQIVTKEFRDKGHDAYSCDILPTSGTHWGWHIQGNVSQILNDDWDLIIAFPPCTHLAASGAKWFKEKREDGRQQQGIDFFMKFTDLKCPKVCIENPVGIMSTIYRKPDQYIQPWEYGHSACKKTGLWLKGLPLLTPTNIVDKGEFYTPPNGKKFSKWHTKCKDAKERSTTFSGIAKSMANQWGLV